MADAVTVRKLFILACFFLILFHGSRSHDRKASEKYISKIATGGGRGGGVGGGGRGGGVGGGGRGGVGGSSARGGGGSSRGATIPIIYGGGGVHRPRNRNMASSNSGRISLTLLLIATTLVIVILCYA